VLTPRWDPWLDVLPLVVQGLTECEAELLCWFAIKVRLPFLRVALHRAAAIPA
jgi:hypothetical protein